MEGTYEMNNSKSKRNFKSISQKFVTAILIIATLSFCICISNNSKSKEKAISSFNMMACAGAITWETFSETAVSTLVLALIPGSQGFKVAEELTKNGAKMNNLAKAIILAKEKVGNPNPAELVWTVVDIIITFLPAGAGMKAAKIALTIPKLIASL